MATVKQVNKVKLPHGAQPLINTALPAIQSATANPTLIPAPAPFNANQIAAQNMALSAAQGPMQDVASGAAGANNFLTNPNILNANSNPALQSYVDASLRPITENFTQSVLPNIRGSAISAGGIGGSRQGIAEGAASGNYLRQLGDTTANIENAGYNTGLNAMIQGTQLAPQTAALQTAPATTVGAVGQQQQDLANANINTGFANAYLPYTLAANTLGLAGAIPGGSSVTKVTGAPSTAAPSALSSLLGGGAAGASLGSSFGPLGTGIGAGLGALYGILSR